MFLNVRQRIDIVSVLQSTDIVKGLQSRDIVKGLPKIEGDVSVHLSKDIEVAHQKIDIENALLKNLLLQDIALLLQNLPIITLLIQIFHQKKNKRNEF